MKVRYVMKVSFGGGSSGVVAVMRPKLGLYETEGWLNFHIGGRSKPRGLGFNTFIMALWWIADVQKIQWPLGLHRRDPHVSIKFYPLPSEQIAACEPPNSPPQISASNNRNWPLLPFSIPVFSISFSRLHNVAQKKQKKKKIDSQRTNPAELAQPQTKLPTPSPPSLPKPHQTVRSHL